ncbi:Stk1 family PASTA domain-containing Ser/Thr kinase [Modestobacter sp. I12A-02628]|uniref:non-specific serine/threonine protein kinase n=1 Tax=Goekera deserti TaxID=2497753 RepID=A0A7K3WFU2_9ACTN|nr:Stk1 family PASTA domain-containing Ser/Thr kinase [Goekera deserti]MPR00111.1 Stk1 family PASTA domain-containing Ser/Thr kinase [Goekera deserti]NDI49890.1 Stk1 family PASTA domain-containing Ser/Thr kinase [Goekera deserti]NEL55252.1 Stk1 family PASTA domain-containing Ser/Thr kinase [Goekera deserti]
MTTPQVLGERYEIGGVLGRGGMAEVHRGRDLRLGREVAVKVLRSDLARDPSFQVRFRREAQASASLNHPAIVAVYDTGEDRTPHGATPYIVMEYVEGETLRDVLRAEGRLTPERAMSLTADICAALDFSHRNGIVHRDVKPGNVMITPQGTVKVMDFGIARAVSDSAATMTSTAAVIGTAQYLSPEQARGEGVDARSDVYSAGCLLYELVTGAPPFTGDSPVAVAYQHVREDPKTPSSINPEIPPELDAILLKSMSKNPANRYQSAAEMRSDLLRAVAGQRVEATPVMGEAERTSLIATTGGYGEGDWDDEDEAAAARRRRGIIAAVVALLVVLIGVVAVVVVMNSGDDAPPPTTSVTVPAGLVTMTRDEAVAALQAVGLDFTETSAESTAEQLNTVLSTDPPSGASVDPGASVALVIGAGPGTITIPQVVGLSQEDAISNLRTQGFTTPPSTRQVSSLEPEGTVVSVDPPFNAAVAPDSSITLGVSTGSVTLPDVRNQTEQDARNALIEAGFEEGDILRMDVERDDVAPDTVVGSDPAPQTQVSAGQEITLQVAVPTPATTPTTPSAPTTGPTSGPIGTTTPTAPTTTTPPAAPSLAPLPLPGG